MPCFPKNLPIIGDDFIAPSLDPPHGLVDVAISRRPLYLPAFNGSNGGKWVYAIWSSRKTEFGT